jgi:hypothetical protein
VWGFTVASAVAAVVVTLLALPLHLWKHQRYAMYGAMHSGAGQYPGGYPTAMHHAGFGLWPVFAIILVAVWAGIGGAIVAAVYNAMVRERP